MAFFYPEVAIPLFALLAAAWGYESAVHGVRHHLSVLDRYYRSASLPVLLLLLAHLVSPGMFSHREYFYTAAFLTVCSTAGFVVAHQSRVVRHLHQEHEKHKTPLSFSEDLNEGD